MIQLPAILIGVLLACLYALAYALVVGKAGRRLGLYALFAIAGCFAGFAVAGHGHWTAWGLGQVPVLECTVASFAMLGVATALRL